MTHQVQHCPAGEGIELTAPDAVLTVKIDSDHTDDHYELFEVDAPRGPATPLHRTGWAKAYYVLHGRMIVQVEDEAFDLGPGSSITIPPAALHTFTVLSPTTKFLACMHDWGDGPVPSRPRRLGASRPPNRAGCATALRRPGSSRCHCCRLRGG